jgi:hypothetical protein
MTIPGVTLHEATMPLLVRCGALIACACAFGCAVGLPPPNAPSVQRLSVVASAPEEYSIRVVAASAATFAVPPSGEVLVEIPSLPHGCSQYFFGMRVSNGSPKAKKAVLVSRRGRVVKKLSLNDLDRLPVDATGRRQLRLR